MKHAYCILAHNEPELLKVLVSLLDDVRNDIYIHLDKMADISKYSVLTSKSSVYFIPRIKVLWGDLSIGIATLN